MEWFDPDWCIDVQFGCLIFRVLKFFGYVVCIGLWMDGYRLVVDILCIDNLFLILFVFDIIFVTKWPNLI